MALLSGIPATIVTGDSRTREMAEFFEIPSCSVSKTHQLTPRDVQEQYLGMDYSKFNQNFETRFRAYEKFLTDHKIVSHVNVNNRFFTSETMAPEFSGNMNQTQFQEFSDMLQRNRGLLQMAQYLRRIRERMPL